jgi:hypothetical protein
VVAHKDVVDVGDIVKVRLREFPESVRVGIVIKAPKKMYMVGNIVEVMISGKIKRVKEEHTQNISKGKYVNEG